MPANCVRGEARRANRRFPASSSCAKCISREADLDPPKRTPDKPPANGVTRQELDAVIAADRRASRRAAWRRKAQVAALQKHIAELESSHPAGRNRAASRQGRIATEDANRRHLERRSVSCGNEVTHSGSIWHAMVDTEQPATDCSAMAACQNADRTQQQQPVAADR